MDPGRRPASPEAGAVRSRSAGMPRLGSALLARRRAPVADDRKWDEDDQDPRDPGDRLNQCPTDVARGQRWIHVEEAAERVGQDRNWIVAREGLEPTWHRRHWHGRG